MSEPPSLFDGLELITGERPRKKYAKAAAYGACPGCSNNHVGLVVFGRGAHLMWKVHHKKFGQSGTSQCLISGQLLCDHPARDVPSLSTETPLCPHDSDGRTPPAC